MRESLVYMRNLGLGGVSSLTRGGRPRSPPLSVAGVLSAALGCRLLCCAGLHAWLHIFWEIRHWKLHSQMKNQSLTPFFFFKFFRFTVHRGHFCYFSSMDTAHSDHPGSSQIFLSHPWPLILFSDAFEHRVGAICLSLVGSEVVPQLKQWSPLSQNVSAANSPAVECRVPWVPLCRE